MSLWNKIKTNFGPVQVGAAQPGQSAANKTKPGKANAPVNLKKEAQVVLALQANGDEMEPPLAVDNNLNSPLLLLSPHRADWLSTKQLCEGVVVFGGTGSGKTSGVGRALRDGLLRKGFGGVVMVAKSDEVTDWIKYCKQNGRSEDLIIFDEDSQFNFLKYEYDFQLSQKSVSIYEIVNVLMLLLELQQKKNGAGKSDEYFQNAARQVLSNAVQALLLAYGTIELQRVQDMVNTAPKTIAEAQDSAFIGQSFCCQTLIKASQDCPERKIPDLELANKFFLVEFARLNDRTRSSIESTLLVTLDSMLRDPLRPMFCSGTTVSPDDVIHRHKIVIVDMSVKDKGDLGRYANAIWKFAVQKAAERNLTRESPIFIWADEAQFFVTSYDQHFATTARSARCITVYLTQNVENLFAEIGGDQAGQARTNSLLGNLNNRFFCLNVEEKTNRWAAELFGKTIERMHGESENSSFSVPLSNPTGASWSTSGGTSVSEQYQYLVQPIEFTRLKNGSEINGCIVDAICQRSGHKWSNGQVYLLAHFPQIDLLGPKNAPPYMGMGVGGRLWWKAVQLGY